MVRESCLQICCEQQYFINKWVEQKNGGKLTSLVTKSIIFIYAQIKCGYNVVDFLN